MTWTEGPVTVLIGDVRARLAELPAESAHCVVTSPPYWGLRDYGVPGQLGLESTPEEYVCRMVEVFREVRRVLRADGTLWLNLGDSYANDTKWGGSSGGKHAAGLHGTTGIGRGKRETGLKAKDLTMIPARLALALQADGWWLRADIIWSKPNPMPESVTDRPTTAHEHVFLLARSQRYFYDAEAVREPAQDREFWGERTQGGDHNLTKNNAAYSRGPSGFGHHPSGRNLRSVWTIATQPYPEAHFATFPEELARRCIAAGTSERGCCPECGAPWRRVVERMRLLDGETPVTGTFSRPDEPFRIPANGVGHWRYTTRTNELGWEPTCKHRGLAEAIPVPCTVLDPFAGSGTTLAVARRTGRRAVGIELQADYLPLIRKRVEEAALPLLESAVD